jgi:LacI family transcriptional regulator
MNQRVTQRDVARRAGVSHVTVSLALRGDPSTPTRTCTRIKAIAAKLGYSPDPMLAALSVYRKSQRPAAYQANIGWINGFADPEKLYEVGDFALYHAGAKQRTRELGYVLEEIRLCDTAYNMNRLRRMLDARSIRGLILAPTTPAGELHLDISALSVVRLGYSFRFPVVNTVTSAQFRTMLMTMQVLINRGYRRIGGLFAVDGQERTSFHFLGGFLAAQSQIPESSRVPPLLLTPDSDRKRIISDWAVKEKLDCVVGSGVRADYELLLDAGLKVPEDIGYADTSLAEDEALLSGMHQNGRKIGRSAVDLLVSMMQRSETGACAIPSHWLIEPSWLEGKTLKPLL